jgi:hypothetical protein
MAVRLLAGRAHDSTILGSVRLQQNSIMVGREKLPVITVAVITGDLLVITTPVLRVV